MSNIKLFQEYESLALDIRASVWISASAGGGKTTIIIKRILKLLLFDVFFPEMFHVEHSKIVVLTYTNEAANEIKKRIKKKLYEWQIDLKNLEQDLDFFEISKNVPRGTFYYDSVKVCRGFFLNEVHLKLKIKSFHSFCAEIVQEYREENDYSNFNKYKIIDDVESTSLLKKISVNYLLKKKEYLYKIPELLDAVEKMTRNCSTWNNFDFNNSLSKFLKLRKAESLDHIVISFLDLEISQIVPRGTIFCKNDKNNNSSYVKNKTKKNCSTWNNLNSINKPKNIKNYSVENIKIMKCSTWNIFMKIIKKWRSINNNFKNCSTWNNFNLNIMKKYYLSHFKRLIDFSNNKNCKDINSFYEYISIFFTLKYEIRKIFSKKKILINILIVKKRKIKDIVNRISNINCLKNSNKFFCVIKDILSEYKRIKSKKNFIDFQDILEKVEYLLSESNDKDWILYQLSKKITHLIVDEAQDNSEKQWNFLKNITSNILYKDGTLFIVGDKKQSIYSFQGAKPELFDVMKDFFIKFFEQNNKKFIFIEWNFSFRVPQNILKYIDNFFNTNNIVNNLTFRQNEDIEHICFNSVEGKIMEIVPRGTIRHTSNFYKSNSNKTNIDKLFHVEQFNNQKKCKIGNNISNCSTWNNLNSINKPTNIKNYSENCSTWNNLNSNNLENQIFSLIKKEIRRGIKQEDIIVLFRSRNTMMKKLLKLFHVEQFGVASNTKVDIMNSPTLTFILLLLKPIVPRGTICHTSNFYKSNSNKTNIDKLFHVEQFNNQKKCKIGNNNSNCSMWNNLNSINKPKNIKNYSENCSTWNNFIKMIKRWKLANTRFKRNCSTWNNLNYEYFKILKYLIGKSYKIQKLIHKLKLLINYLSSSEILDIINNSIGQLLDKKTLLEIKKISSSLISQNLSSIHCFINYIESRKNLEVAQNQHKSKIRIMTIHGSKGLEADTVILIDDILERKFNHKLYINNEYKLFVKLSNDYSNEVKILRDVLEEEDFRESCRLLYVAMTRTKKKLIIIKPNQ